MSSTDRPSTTEHTPSKPRGAHPVVWAVGAVVVAVTIILVLGAIDTPDGDPIVKNPEALITQILITAGVIGAATLPLLIKTQRDAAAAKEQVSNDHSTNLRVENDERHNHVVELVTTKFDELTKHFNRQFDGIRDDVRAVADDGRNTRDKLDKHLEKSEQVIEEFKHEIGELHKINSSLEDTIPATELRESEEPKQEE